MEQSSRIDGPARSGLSLLEILFSVFVLSIGLLGVAAVIPLGHHQMLEATKSDRAAACGRAGLHEIKTRGWINPLLWRQISVDEMDPTETPGFPGPPPIPRPYTRPVTRPGPGIRMRDSFAIDPLFFVHQGLPDYDNSINPMAWRFPLDASSTVYDDNNNGGWEWRSRQSSLIRVTVIPNANWYDTSTTDFVQRMPFSAASRIFTWRDDILFPVPDDPDDRPRQLVMADGGEGLAYPRRVATSLTPVTAQADGNYSWMATVTPVIDGQAGDFPDDGVDPNDPAERLRYTYVDNISHYVVSVVVFYNRNFECPADLSDPEYPPQERSLQVFFPGDGYGGGDVLLIADSSSLPWLEVKKNDWLMLRGLELVGPIDMAVTEARLQPYWRTVAKWYRVVAVDEIVDGDDSTTDPIQSGSTGRYVTLSGPDWRVDTDGDGQFEPMIPLLPGNSTFDWAIATLVDDVIGVYTTTVEAE